MSSHRLTRATKQQPRLRSPMTGNESCSVHRPHPWGRRMKQDDAVRHKHNITQCDTKPLPWSSEKGFCPNDTLRSFFFEEEEERTSGLKGVSFQLFTASLWPQIMAPQSNPE